MIASRVLVVLGLAFGACGCAVEDVVIAELPEPPDGGARERRPCVDGRDCPPSLFCARGTCGDAVGQCEVRPVFCEPKLSPVCGCDGVTYWNDCVRRLSGATAQTDGECTVGAALCDGGGGDCPVRGASCARFLPAGAPCEGRMPGVCWMLPTECPRTDGPVFEACHSSSPLCAGACSAIRSERPHRARSSASCP